MLLEPKHKQTNQQSGASSQYARTDRNLLQSLSFNYLNKKQDKIYIFIDSFNYTGIYYTKHIIYVFKHFI